MTPLSSSAILIAGATASGKSAVAVELARRINGEIISVDSMQVYRGLDLGTAKPTVAERAGIPHHLIDVLDVDEPFDAARFVELAERAVADIKSRGRRPILCGGTGFYFKALLCGLGEAPPADADLRRQLEATPAEALLDELQAADPATFARIDRANPRRVVRALEIIRLTGKPVAVQQAPWQMNHEAGSRRHLLVALRREPAELRQRIDNRVDQMFAAGLVAETQELLARGLAGNRTAMQAIGYRQVVEHLRGERDLAATVALVKTRTWQFARRQLTWLRGQLQPRWVDVPAGRSAGEVADELQKLDEGARLLAAREDPVRRHLE